MNPNRARYVAAARTTGGVIQAIVLQLIAHINYYALWVTQFSCNLIRRNKASAMVLDFKLLRRTYGSCRADWAATLLPCIESAMQ
jgi:hypothetical protein